MSEAPVYPTTSVVMPLCRHEGEDRVLENDEYRLWSPRKQATLIVKKGFRFRASSPRPLWWLFAPSDCSEPGSLGHDALYQSQGDPDSRPDICAVEPAGTRWGKVDSDHDYNFWMRRDPKMKQWRRPFVFGGVYVVGWVAWFKNGAGAR